MTSCDRWYCSPSRITAGFDAQCAIASCAVYHARRSMIETWETAGRLGQDEREMRNTIDDRRRSGVMFQGGQFAITSIREGA